MTRKGIKHMKNETAVLNESVTLALTSEMKEKARAKFAQSEHDLSSGIRWLIRRYIDEGTQSGNP